MFRIMIICAVMLVPLSIEAALIDQVSKVDLQDKYNEGEKIKILIVPGHDNDFSGAVFAGVREVELNRVLSLKLFELFMNDPSFSPTITQVDGDYTPELKEYFEDNWTEIEDWRIKKSKEMKKLLKRGKIEPFEGVEHNVATTTVIQRLYGINKWANENEFDLIIHVHFNDYGGRRRNETGDYTGFSIYIPENKMLNADAADDLAQGIYDRLNKVIIPSNLPVEAKFGGPIPGRELIANGANNTLGAPSILVEYAYIYEGIAAVSFNAGLFDNISGILAKETYEGIKDFFRPKDIEYDYHLGDSIHNWRKNLGREKNLNKVLVNEDVLLLQMALRRNGVYPSKGRNSLECPITGKFGECTELALKEYQIKNNITPATGFLGPITRDSLNQAYGK